MRGHHHDHRDSGGRRELENRHNTHTRGYRGDLQTPLDRTWPQLLRDPLSRRGEASYAIRPDRWLFPGGLPGKHMVTENVRSQLVSRGSQPSHARRAAMF